MKVTKNVEVSLIEGGRVPMRTAFLPHIKVGQIDGLISAFNARGTDLQRCELLATRLRTVVNGLVSKSNTSGGFEPDSVDIHQLIYENGANQWKIGIKFPSDIGTGGPSITEIITITGAPENLVWTNSVYHAFGEGRHLISTEKASTEVSPIQVVANFLENAMSAIRALSKEFRAL